MVPEEMLVSATGKNIEYMTRRIRESSLSKGKPILSDAQIEELVEALEKVHTHFAAIYGKDPRDPSFGMDVEWKILENGKLWIKQARPVVD
jgi:phosphoenolpyruvate synthase/pyruvate phosphate dikinase